MARIRTAVSRLASCGCAAFCLALLLAWLMPTTRAQAQEVSLDDVRDSLGDDFTFVDLPHIRMFENRPERLVVNTDPNTGRFRGSLNDRIPLPPSQEHKEVSEVAIEVEVDGAVNSQTGEVGLTLKRKETLTTVHEGKERERIAASLKGNLTGKLEWHIVPPHAWGLPGFAVGERVLGFSCTGSLRLTIEGHWREGKEITPNPPPTDITASCTAVGPHREQRPPVVFVPGIAGSLL